MTHSDNLIPPTSGTGFVYADTSPKVDQPFCAICGAELWGAVSCYHVQRPDHSYCRVCQECGNRVGLNEDGYTKYKMKRRQSDDQ